MKVLNQWRLK